MCQSKSEGGKRCAAHQPAFLATKTLLKRTYGASEEQIKHAYRQARENTPKKSKETASKAQYDAWVKKMEPMLATLSPAHRSRVQKQMENGRDIPAYLINVIGTLPDDVQTQMRLIERNIETLAKRYSTPVSDVRAEFENMRKDDMTRPYARDAGGTLDERTRLALMRTQSHLSTSQEPQRRIVLLPTQNSNVVSRIGWSAEDGRLEMEMQNGVHAFRNVDAEQWERIQRDPASFLNREAHNAFYQYNSPDEAAADAYRVWCDKCQGYRLLSTPHRCGDPINRAYRSIQQELISTDQPDVALPAWAQIWEKRENHDLGDNPNPKSVTQIAEDDGIVHFSLTAQVDGKTGGEVTANFEAGRVAPTSPVMVMTTNPRCTCLAYKRNYRCPHINGFVEQARDFQRAVSEDDYFDNQQMVMPPEGTTPITIEGEQISEENTDNGVAMLRLGRTVRYYFQTDTLAGAVNVRNDRGIISAGASAMCQKCGQVADCPHIDQIRSQILQNVQERMYTPAFRLEELSTSLIPERVSATDRERATKPYSHDLKAYISDYREIEERVRAGDEVLQFQAAPVTNGALGQDNSGRGFGVELEFSTDDPETLRRIANELSRNGLSDSRRVFGYGAGAAEKGYNSGWIVEEDVSTGGEVISPVLYDNADSWESLRNACDIIKRCGGRVDDTAGGHIHIGADYNPSRDAQVLRFLLRHQDSLRRVNKNPGNNAHRANGYSLPHTNMSVQEALYTLSDAPLTDQHPLRNRFVNLRANDDKTVEFRDPDGSLNPALIQTQVMTYASLVDKTERGVITSTGSDGVQAVGTNLRRRYLLAGTRQHLTDEELIVSDIAYRNTIDALHDEPEARKRMVALGVLNDWQDDEN